MADNEHDVDPEDAGWYALSILKASVGAIAQICEPDGEVRSVSFSLDQEGKLYVDIDISLRDMCGHCGATETRYSWDEVELLAVLQGRTG